MGIVVESWDMPLSGEMKIRFYCFDVSLPESSEVCGVWCGGVLNKAIYEFYLVDSLTELFSYKICASKPLRRLILWDPRWYGRSPISRQEGLELCWKQDAHCRITLFTAFLPLMIDDGASAARSWSVLRPESAENEVVAGSMWRVWLRELLPPIASCVYVCVRCPRRVQHSKVGTCCIRERQSIAEHMQLEWDHLAWVDPEPTWNVSVLHLWKLFVVSLATLVLLNTETPYVLMENLWHDYHAKNPNGSKSRATVDKRDLLESVGLIEKLIFSL